MCSINGCVDFLAPDSISREEVAAAGARMARRGPDGHGRHDARGVSFYHNRLAVMDPAGGKQPMSAVWQGRRYTIVYNGEIYNTEELRRDLAARGAVFFNASDTEVLLWSYIMYGEDCPKHLNGIFAFAVHDEARERVFVARDRLGVKPFFYTVCGAKFFFASEPSALFAHREIRPRVDCRGLWQLFYLTPVTLPGKSVFADIAELRPGYCGYVTVDGFRSWAYWQLQAAPFTDTPAEAAERVRALFTDAVVRQLQSDVPLAVLLSGGLDSSAITAVAARALRKKGKALSTYSFEYEGNRTYFKSTLFQPQGDDAYAEALADELCTCHRVLTAPTDAVADALYPAAEARDLPGQADIDSSLLYFCREIKSRHTVLLSGECSDEIFGGYPWFYRPEMLAREPFPWLHDPAVRIELFDSALTRPAEGLAFVKEEVQKSRAACPYLDTDSAADRTAREATWLSCHYFMTNLLCRKDRMSMYSGVEVRVPFADHRILEYVFNVPWAIKYENGVEKALLRRAMTGYLPESVLWRKKSPYPKTHNPAYETRVREMLGKALGREGFLSTYLDRKKLAALLEGDNTTWFGQLMARPQLIAWLCQLDHWFEHLHVELI